MRQPRVAVDAGVAEGRVFVAAEGEDGLVHLLGVEDFELDEQVEVFDGDGYEEVWFELGAWGSSWQDGAANLHTFRLAPVGAYPEDSRPYGIDDMAGNVVEWAATIDQKGRAILRGGFESNYLRGRTTDRDTELAPDFANFDIGFRCVW